MALLWHAASAQHHPGYFLLLAADSTDDYPGCFAPLSKTTDINNIYFTGRQNTTGDKPRLLSVHGDISYDFQYRSLLDTPYYQRDFRQHAIQANLQFVYKEKYPFRLVIRQQYNNSPFFRNRIDANALWNDKMLVEHVKKRLLENPESWLRQQHARLYDEADSLKQKLAGMIKEMDDLKMKVSDGAIFSELVKVKERFVEKEVQRMVSGKDSLLETIPDKETAKKEVMNRYDSLLKQGADAWLKDSTGSEYLSKLSNVRDLLIKRQSEWQQIKNKLDQLQKTIEESQALARRQVRSITSMAELDQFLKDKPDVKKMLPAKWNILSGIRHVGIGRSWLDYSELTIKNISLTGVHAELNYGRLYLAGGAGKVAARFRDFVLHDNNVTARQNLHFLRAGLGRKTGSFLILTYYSGQRAMYAGRRDSLPSYQRVRGLSLENQIRINEHHAVTLEVARSTFGGAANADKQEGWAQIFNFRDRSNEAYSARFTSYFPVTATALSGFYRKAGYHFQSFNLQPTNARQEAFGFRLKQPMLKKRLMMEAGVRKNDFEGSSVFPLVQSKAVLTTLTASLRVPGWPSVMAGFYPGSQLTMLANDIVAENQYNTLTATVSHTYRIKAMPVVTYLSYVQFFNSGSDTSFIYYNAKNWTVGHRMYLEKSQWQTDLAYAAQPAFTLFTLAQSVDVTLKKWLQLQAGLKYHAMSNDAAVWGTTGGLAVQVPALGRIQLQYERSYLPGANRNLVPVNMGRVNFYKIF